MMRQAGKWLVLALLVGCQQKMAEQPSYKPLDACQFFADGLSARPAVPGTVARGHLETDIALFTGRRVGKDGRPMGLVTPTVVQPPPGSPEEEQALKARYDQFVDTFPFPMTESVLQRGHDRFMIYCVVCHDPLGTGRGKIVERGYTQPPSYHIPRLRSAPVGHLFAVVTEGYGSMPSYGEQIPVRDRWAIVGYVRALQFSQHFHFPASKPQPFTGPGSRPRLRESSAPFAERKATSATFAEPKATIAPESKPQEGRLP
jgi:mono/diheme cytochrome c family protein